MRWFSFIIPACLLSLLLSCTATNPDPNPPVPDNPSGSIYINVVGYFSKFDVAKDSLLWSAMDLNLFNSYRNPLVLDSSGLYRGNYGGITCYNASTGLVSWSHSWIAFSDAINYREPVFNDTQVFYTTPTSVWDHGYLFCKNKFNGVSKWTVQIDSGDVFTGFNGVPLVVGDKVVTITRSQNNEKRLTAFSVQNGSRIWSVPVSSTIPSRLQTSGGNIFSLYGPEAFCFDATNGNQLWRTDLNAAASFKTYSFFENDKLVIVHINGNNQYKITQLQKGTGVVVSSRDLTVPTGPVFSSSGYPDAHRGCYYKNNKIYISSFENYDSLNLFAYDVNSLTQIWRKGLLAHTETVEGPPVFTDKYFILLLNTKKTTDPDYYGSKMVFIGYDGKLVKEVPFLAIYTDGFVYKENGVVFHQIPGYR